jgi:hypothetical protein
MEDLGKPQGGVLLGLLELGQRFLEKAIDPGGGEIGLIGRH